AIPDELGDEAAPPTEAELREQRQAALYAGGIQFVVDAHRVQVRECYERAFKDESEPPAGDRVEIAFTVGADGRAGGAHSIDNTTGSAVLGACLAARVG